MRRTAKLPHTSRHDTLLLDRAANALEATRSRPGPLAPSFPLSGLSAIIADAMWDERDARIGGPQAAAEAVEAAGYMLLSE